MTGADNVDLSVILPIGRDRAGLTDVIGGYTAELRGLHVSFEVILVLERGSSGVGEISGQSEITVVQTDRPQWGTSIRAGLAASRGDLLCYLDWTQTPPGALKDLLKYGLADPTLVLKASRRTRENPLRRAGSLLFNLECRMLLGVATWDVNGTPKVFSRSRDRLLELGRNDALIDAQFCLICRQERFPVLEIPVDAVSRRGRPAPYSLRSAARMFLGVSELRRTQP